MIRLKRVVCLITAFMMLLLTSCGNNDAESEETTENTVSEKEEDITQESVTEVNAEDGITYMSSTALSAQTNAEKTTLKKNDTTSKNKETTTKKIVTTTKKKVTTTKKIVTTTKKKVTTTKKTVTATEKIETTRKPTTTKKPSTTKESTDTGIVKAEHIAKIKTSFINLINNERKSKGLSPLNVNKELERAATVRSKEIMGTWSHTRPNGKLYYTAVNENDYYYQVIGENIGVMSFKNDSIKYTGSDEQLNMVSKTLFDKFKSSPDHYENIGAAYYKDTGVGISYKTDANGMPVFYLSQIFGSR